MNLGMRAVGDGAPEEIFERAWDKFLFPQYGAEFVCGEGCMRTLQPGFRPEGLASKRGEIRRIWQCGERYKVKGVLGCGNRHVEESTLEKAFVMVWNGILENRDYFWQKWEKQKESENLLEVYRAVDFRELVKSGKSLEKMETDLMLQVLDHIKVFENGTLMVVFLDGTEIECKSEE